MDKLPRAELLSVLDMPQTIELTTHRGQVISTRRFMAQHLDLLSAYEQPIASSLLHLLPDDTKAYPFASPLAIATEPDGQGIFASSVGSRSAIFSGLYIKGCRPIDHDALWFPGVEMDVYSGVCQQQQIAFGVLSRENISRELLGYLIFCQQGWPLARHPVAVLAYQTADADSFALVFKPVEGYCRVEQLLVDQHITIADLIAMNLAGQEAMNASAAPKLLHVGLSEYLALKAELLAKTHAQGVFRGYLNANAGNDLYQHEGHSFTIVDFDTLQLVEIASATTDELRQALLRSAFIEAAKSMLPMMQFVWFEDKNHHEHFAAIEQIVKENGWMQQYADCLTQQLLCHGWCKQDVLLGWSAARQHPLYQAALTDAVICSPALLDDYSPTESLYRPQF